MANNPYINKVEYGGNTLIDLTSDTVDSSNLLSGYTAHDRSGAQITGSVVTADVIDNLTSTSTTDALSAKQGKALQDTKVNISDIKDNLTSTDTNKPLSAKQGKVLDEKIDGLYTEVTDNEPYTLRQGKGDMVDMELVGGSFAWNQLVQNGNFASTSGWSKNQPDYTTFSVSNNVATVVTTKRWGGIYSSRIVDANNHVVFRSVEYKSTLKARIYDKSYVAKDTFTEAYIIDKTTGIKLVDVYSDATDQENTINIRNAVMFDLTQMFGTTIADAIYAMEQATSGSGVAFFRKYFPNAYYAYDTGSIQSVCVSGRKVYDSDNNLMANYPIPTQQLRGLFTIENGNLKANGDILESSGKLTRKFGIVDLGNLGWTYVSNYQIFANTSFPNVKPVGANAIPNAICSIYTAGSWNDVATDTSKNMMFCVLPSANQIRIRNTAYTDATAFKTAMNGVYLVYELTTPTTESALPFQNPQRSDASGTEEFVDYGVESSTRDVSIPVGHNSTYKSSEVIQPLEDYVDGAIEAIPVVSKSANGLCPKLPNESTTTKFLRQDGSWEVPPNDGTTYTAGTNINISEQNVISATDTITEKLYATGSYTSSTSAVTTVTATNANISIDSTTPVEVFTDVFGVNLTNMTVSGSGTSATISITFPKTTSAQTINYRVYVKTI